MSRYKAALFDFDGTLTDTSPGIFRCAKETGRQLGLPPPCDEEFRFFIGPPIMDSFRKVYGLSEEEAAKAKDLYRRIQDETGGVYEAEVYAGMKELLADLRRDGIKTAVASMKRFSLLDRSIDIFGFRDLFDAVLGAPEGLARGSKPDLIRAALRELGATADEAVMIGDSTYDGDAAEETGTAFIGVRWGFGFEDDSEILKYPNSAVAHTMDELRDLLMRP